MLELTELSLFLSFSRNYSLKQHKSNRPIRMKSDMKRTRATHKGMLHQADIGSDACGNRRRRSASGTSTPTSPRISRNSSPEHDCRERQSVEREAQELKCPGFSDEQLAKASQAHSVQFDKDVSGSDLGVPSQDAFYIEHGPTGLPNSHLPSNEHLGRVWAENHQANQIHMGSVRATDSGVGLNEIGKYRNIMDPFLANDPSSYGDDIVGQDRGSLLGVVVDSASQNMEGRKSHTGRGGEYDAELIDKSFNLRRLSADAYASHIADKPDPPSSASSSSSSRDARRLPLPPSHLTFSSHTTSLPVHSSDLLHSSNMSDTPLIRLGNKSGNNFEMTGTRFTRQIKPLANLERMHSPSSDVTTTAIGRAASLHML